MLRILDDPLYLVSIVISLLVALTVHEYSHARVALSYGDPTAKGQGRLTLNPISHLDPIGTLMILIAGFGWARPVPINPMRFRDLRKGLLWVSLAGPISNFILAFISLLIYILAFNYGVRSDFFQVLMLTMVQLNMVLGIFNLIPLPPLDGSKILQTFLPPAALRSYQQIEPYAPIILILLIVTGAFRLVLFPLTNFLISTFQNIILFFTNFLF